MKASSTIYNSSRLAAGYAFSRPNVHPMIAQRISAWLQIAIPASRALDVGCGAGLSTAALAPLARSVVGIDTVPAMLAHRRSVAPRASFVVARAEQLPVTDDAFELVTAAGSINYTDTQRFLSEAARVLKPDGVLVIYDFSAGRRFRNDGRLGDWYTAFEQRYPPQPGYALDVRELPFSSAGLRLDSYEDFEVAVAMSLEAYVAYAMSESGVELAISRGANERDIADWCKSTLANLFDGAPRDVFFDAYVAYATPESPGMAGRNA
jgi:SAM-dependent methyltransferase